MGNKKKGLVLEIDSIAQADREMMDGYTPVQTRAYAYISWMYMYMLFIGF